MENDRIIFGLKNQTDASICK